jgi:release factor glutamine methyltransferase
MNLDAFDVIVANLPYVAEGEWPDLQPEVRGFDPRGALVAGRDGAEIVVRLIEVSPSHPERGGVVAVEIGDGQAARVSAAARERFPDGDVCVIKDLAGIDRVVRIQRQEGG